MKSSAWGKYVFLSVLFHFMFMFCSFGQQERILTGTVRNEKAEPLSGVTVTVSRTNSLFRQATSTAADGGFRIVLSGEGSYHIVFSYIGYTQKAETVTIEGAMLPALNITLQPGTGTVGEEVVVVGYGRTSKRNVTGSVKSLKSAEPCHMSVTMKS